MLYVKEQTNKKPNTSIVAETTPFPNTLELKSMIC